MTNQPTTLAAKRPLKKYCYHTVLCIRRHAPVAATQHRRSTDVTKHTREKRAQAWLKVLATTSELRKAQALAPSGHERDEQLPEAWRHGEPTHSNTTFRVRISQHKLLGLFSLKLLFGYSGGLTEGWGYRGFWWEGRGGGKRNSLYYFRFFRVNPFLFTYTFGYLLKFLWKYWFTVLHQYYGFCSLQKILFAVCRPTVV